MRKWFILVCVAMVFVFGRLESASADNSLRRGEFALNVVVDDTPLFSAKYLLRNDLALLGGFGLSVNGGDADGTDFVIGGGIRKYLTVSDFAPYVGARAAYASTEDNDVATYLAQAEAGAEVFLQKHLSVEATAAIGLSYTDEDLTGRSYYRFGNSTAGISFNFYYP